MSGALNMLKSVASFVAPVLDLVSAIPGIGQISSLVKSGLSILSNLDTAFSNFPKGLAEVAVKAFGELLPTPIKQIASFVTNPGKGLMDLLPVDVSKFLPASLTPAIPGVVNDLIDDWL